MTNDNDKIVDKKTRDLVAHNTAEGIMPSSEGQNSLHNKKNQPMDLVVNIGCLTMANMNT